MSDPSKINLTLRNKFSGMKPRQKMQCIQRKILYQQYLFYQDEDGLIKYSDYNVIREIKVFCF